MSTVHFGGVLHVLMLNRGSYVNAQRRGRSGFRSEIGNCPLLHAHLLLESQLSQVSSAFFSQTYPFYHIKLTLHSYSSNQYAFDQRKPTSEQTSPGRRVANLPRFPSRKVPMPPSSTRKSAHIQVQPTYIDHGSAKKQVTEQGGKITTEFKLIKGFTYVSLLQESSWLCIHIS